jgi:subtilase family serine protease
MKQYYLIVLLLIFGLVIIDTKGNVPSIEKEGLLKGRLVDINKAILPGETIVISNKTNSWEVKTDLLGEYQINLPIGIYQITVKSPGFFPFQRASFQINENSSAVIDIQLIPTNEIICELVVDSEDKEIKAANSLNLNYDEFITDCFIGNSNLNLIINFSNKQENKQLIEYTRVVLSYNLFTVYADKMIFDKKSLLLKASENVVVREGEHNENLDVLEVKFGSCEPKIILKVLR